MDIGLNYDGLRPDGSVGDVVRQWLQLRDHVGVLKARTKDKVRFKVRSNDELVDKVRGKANELGLLIRPVLVNGKGQVIAGDEDGKYGTYAEVELTLRVTSATDGSMMDIAGFGLGADNMDKAGGKAGTYAFKSAMLQALLAAGAEDTDDTDTPIKGGVRPARKPRVDPDTALAAVIGALKESTTQEQYKAAVLLFPRLTPEQQVLPEVREIALAARARCFPKVPEGTATPS